MPDSEDLGRSVKPDFDVETAAGIWHWDKLWKEHGFTARPR
jgi:hypothetical protein